MQKLCLVFPGDCPSDFDLNNYRTVDDEVGIVPPGDLPTKKDLDRDLSLGVQPRLGQRDAK